ncbi:hypothetical protein CspeluHIS016_0403660 [Cutaneotrichosporon spelunceum]|uniref:DNA polymerase epsilon subunit D n=1 Tax=Cutaneotrichosporon spelunceum TaxID=1672016 RepID=A0AAD3YD28_9TREE|nr:hypothetical protein CspeluHIS016_0403660 [Cutaneotrichosporon spelunceum]
MKPRTSTSAPKAPAKHPSAAQQAAYTHSIADLELPKTTLTKLAKGSIPDNVKMQQDVVHALLRGSTLFINYLSAALKRLYMRPTCAHDQAVSRSGKQITAGDVLKAIADLDFGPSDALIPLLEQELASYRAIQVAAKARKAPPKKRGKEPEEGMAVDEEEEEEEEQEEGGDEEEEHEEEEHEGAENGA